MVRRVDKIPSGWGNNLLSLERHQQMINSIKNEEMWMDRILQNPLTLDRTLINANNFGKL
ncbi:hypothetical protein Cha6605_5579 [Chamaesiphon minutus PCC 6605]|uniref:Uncharacterized protein n=1 Tax=Chamaesiphon minutus (strain ATCC 27169 / PCC 6605) TaxID=1173020 RepID=K9UQE7_CHAP6|nr:hypothetical protein Cha6605_5579 [Chamaesiphon minutus PCC 6605]